MANVVVGVLSVTIGLFFVLIGTIKLTPAISDEVYKEMGNYDHAVALITMPSLQAHNTELELMTGWKPSPHLYRRVIGVTEVTCGLLLALVPGPLKQFANVMLFLVSCAALYSHCMLHDTLDKMTSSLIFGLLLICRFVVRLQVNSREEKLRKEATVRCEEEKKTT